MTDRAYGHTTRLRSYSSHQFQEGEVFTANGHTFLVLTVRDAPAYERHNQEAHLFQFDSCRRLLPECTACGGLEDAPHTEEYYCRRCFRRAYQGRVMKG